MTVIPDGRRSYFPPTGNYALPADRATTWQPGVTYNGGIPTTRTQFGAMLTPSGGNDITQIQNAINACPSGQYVLLGPGTFQITGTNPLFIGKSNITLRGSGAGITTLHRTDGAVDGSFNTNANAPVLIAGPNGRFPGGAGFASFNLTVDGAHGATSVTVSGGSAGTFVVGQIVLIDEMANESYVPANDGHGTTVLTSDDGLLTWAAWDPEVNPGGIQEDARTNAYSRDHRITCEYKEVASWNSGTGVLTFTSPIHAQYRVNHTAQVCTFATADTPLKNIGVEMLTMDRGDNGLFYMQNCAYSWVKNVELTKWLGEGMRFFCCFRCELRDSYVHTPVYFEPGGGSYNIAIDTGSAEILVENCISRDANKVIVARGAGAGSVVAYNYMDDGHIGSNPAWQEMGVGGSHFIGPHHMLFEGNWGYNGDNDKTHGNSWGHTYLRNHLTGKRSSYDTQSTGRCAGVTRTTKKMSFIGNVLGLSGQMTGLTYETGSQSTDAVWRMGWDDWPPNLQDLTAIADTIRDGNYDYLTNQVRWHGLGGLVGAGTARPIPNSWYLSSRPDFFGANTWPWVDPTGATKIYTLPAKARYDAGTPNDTVPSQLLRTSVSNTHFLVNEVNQAVLLGGSHTWNNFQDIGQGTVVPIDFDVYVDYLYSHGHNCTILWRKDLPQFFNWGAGGTWRSTIWPWPRTGPGNATDGLLKFDLSQFDQTFFDRLRTRALKLRSVGIYAIIEFFDGLGVNDNRGSTDGYPFTAANNINGIGDGYSGSGAGVTSYTMNAQNAIVDIQDALVRKFIDTLNDLWNVIWEHSEEAPTGSNWWQDHMISLIHTYEAGKPFQHPVLYPTLNVSAATDSTLYGSAADVVATLARTSPTSNSGNKAIINDSDHSYFGMWNDTNQQNRNYVWENVCNGNSVIWMDPYFINWTTGSRNLCVSPVNGVCSGVDTRWDIFRENLGTVARYGRRMNLIAMIPQPSLASTGWCLASAGAEYLVYAPSGGTFTVNLSAASGKQVAVEWFNPATIAYTTSANVAGGSAAQSFTPPGGFTADALLYLKVL